MSTEESVLSPWLHPLPDQRSLTSAVAIVLRDNGYACDEITVLDRERCPYSSTFPTEIVTTRVAEGGVIRLFCKYGVAGDNAEPGRRPISKRYARGGPAYEAAIYRDVLRPTGLSAPRALGGYVDSSTGQTWLILEYLEDSCRIEELPPPHAMGDAARWVGQFHRVNQTRLPAMLPQGLLFTYDAEYYLGFARRTSEYAAYLHNQYPWLQSLCNRFEEVVDVLLTPPPTIIHGEYCPTNVLYRKDEILPVDWESAAIGVGEIDLAALTDGWWKAEIVRQCELEYERARWPQGRPLSFERTLAAARLYLNFRWLGDWAPDTLEQCRWRFEPLRRAGEQLGLI